METADSKTTTYTILGMMSGTSMDGLDLAACHFELQAGAWKYTFLATESQPYQASLKNELVNAIHLKGDALMALHHRYGLWLGSRAKDFLNRYDIRPDGIASHGHTVHHRPGEGFTFQLGSGHELAIAAGYPVICDFRSLDVALGGQGAPLVPIGDRLLFRQYDACINLGGISNISFEDNGYRIAYDIGLANMPINYLSRKLGKELDKGGAMAREGNLQDKLLSALNALDYYKKSIPKSTGVEWFNTEVAPLLDCSNASLPDQLHTVTVHVAQQLASALGRHAGENNWNVLVTGGGARNDFLMEKVKSMIPDHISIQVPGPELLEFKEALVFALLGALRMEGKTNILASVTGASRDSCSGVLFYPPL